MLNNIVKILFQQKNIRPAKTSSAWGKTTGHYSRTSRKQKRRMRRLVTYEKRTTSEKIPGHIYFMEDNLLRSISKLRYVHLHVT